MLMRGLQAVLGVVVRSNMLARQLGMKPFAVPLRATLPLVMSKQRTFLGIEIGPNLSPHLPRYLHLTSTNLRRCSRKKSKGTCNKESRVKPKKTMPRHHGKHKCHRSGSCKAKLRDPERCICLPGSYRHNKKPWKKPCCKPTIPRGPSVEDRYRRQ